MSKNAAWVNEVRRMVKDECGLDSAVEQRKHLHVRFTDGPTRAWTWIVSATPSAQGARRHALRDLIAGLRNTFGVDCLHVHDFSIQMFVSLATAEREEKRQLELAWEAFHQRLLDLHIPDPAVVPHRPETPKRKAAATSTTPPKSAAEARKFLK